MVVGSLLLMADGMLERAWGPVSLGMKTTFLVIDVAGLNGQAAQPLSIEAVVPKTLSRAVCVET
jgi:hypothetical protein